MVLLAPILSPDQQAAVMSLVLAILVCKVDRCFRFCTVYRTPHVLPTSAWPSPEGDGACLVASPVLSCEPPLIHKRPGIKISGQNSSFSATPTDILWNMLLNSGCKSVLLKNPHNVYRDNR